MQDYRALLVDAFTDEPLTGNAAGVVPDADELNDAQMQAIARELAVSETAFVTESSEADRGIRYFTPTTEVDLCGHATIGAHAALFGDGIIDAGTHTLETNVGVLDIEVTGSGRIWMTQAPPEVEEVDIDYEAVGEALGIDPAAMQDVGADLPAAVASTGAAYLVIPVNFLEHLSGMNPDMAAIEALEEEYDCTGVYAFTFDALDRESTLHARMFAPGAGIPEDPVTGTGAGACGAYLQAADAFEGDLPEEMLFEQGHFVDRPGLLRVRVDGDEVRVGGDAAASFDGTLSVPSIEDDEILEA